MSCPRPYARLRPLLKEQIPNRDRTYNALINLRDREFFDSFLHLAVGLPNALSVTRWLVSEGADPSVFKQVMSVEYIWRIQTSFLIIRELVLQLWRLQ